MKCYADSEEDTTGKSCDPSTKPHTEDVCNLVECPDGEFSKFSKSEHCLRAVLASFTKRYYTV